jgi:hypothetical protein
MSPDALEQRKNLWTALSKYVHANGGWVTSVPNRKVVRIECQRGGPVPERLESLGYAPRYIGPQTKLVAGKFEPVSVYEIIVV